MCPFSVLLTRMTTVHISLTSFIPDYSATCQFPDWSLPASPFGFIFPTHFPKDTTVLLWRIPALAQAGGELWTLLESIDYNPSTVT
jgi:hypothetical protein